MDAVLDAKGLQCPLPILKTKKAINLIEVGDVLTVHATDSGSMKDMQIYCKSTGHDLLESREEQGVFTYLIKKTS